MKNNLLAKKLTIIALAVLFVANLMVQYNLYEQNASLERELIITSTELKSAEDKINKTQGELATLQKDVQNKAGKEDVERVKENLTYNLTGLTENVAKLENKIFDPAKIYKKTKKATVSVAIGNSSGAGFLFGERNLIVTTYHVVEAGPGTVVSVFPNDGTLWTKGEIKMVKPEWDLAIIELFEPLNAEPLAPGTQFSIGDPVLAIGNPSGYNNSASTGVISGFNRKLNPLPNINFIQVDPSIYFGNSGGPIIDRNGKVIGVISQAMNAFTFSFAVPIDYVQRLLEEE